MKLAAGETHFQKGDYTEATKLLNEAVGLIAYPLFYGRADGAE